MKDTPIGFTTPLPSALTADTSSLGGHDKTVRLWDRDTGKLVRIFEGHTAWVHSVAFSPDGRYIVSGSVDASLKIWNSETGKLLATMVGFKDNDWVSYTPDNYYNASPKGDKYVTFRIGNKLYDFEQYADIYKRPDIVASILRGEDIKKAVAKVEQDTGVEVSKVSIADIPPPEVVIKYIKCGERVLEPEVQQVDCPEITIVAQAIERKHGVERIKIELNGKTVFEKKGLKQKVYDIKEQVTLKDKENTITLLAYGTTKVKSYPQEIHIFYKEELLKGMSLPREKRERERERERERKEGHTLISDLSLDKQKVTLYLLCICG
ncbi:MAG: NTPase [Candidatus Scalindua rubra]|uniref:NTPase n=1 Tax=Candidatus Scalindua rubra TaxID=1872076 RepID=A0A1E3X8K4_9BACT|nr:MAG: NTPase [Candidatus Scalindua rubra]